MKRVLGFALHKAPKTTVQPRAAENQDVVDELEGAVDKEDKRHRAAWKTWERFQRQANSGLKDALPLKPESLKKTVLTMRRAGYRSTSNYLMHAKAEHQMADWPWGSKLELAYRRASRLAKRKLGPPRRARTFSLRKLARAHAMGIGPRTNIKMPHQTVSAATLCLMRGVETGTVAAADVVMCNKQVAIRISASKTDPMGRGIRFRWSCTCGGVFYPRRSHSESWMLCVYHNCRYIAEQAHGFKTSDKPKTVGTSSQNFFTTKNGKKLNATAIGKFLKAMSAVFDLEVEDDFDAETNASFSGHSLRRTGAQHWFRAGLPVATIRRLARWQSEVIESYLASAPLSDLGTHSFENQKTVENSVSVTRLLPEMQRLLNLHLLQVKQKFEELKKSATSPTVPTKTKKALEMPIIGSFNHGKIQRAHRIRAMAGARAEWSCWCGYKFGASTCVAFTEEEAKEQGVKRCTRGCYATETWT